VIAAGDPCDGVSHLEEIQCLGEEITAAEREMAAAYESALSELAEVDPTDNRKVKAQLRASQDAWLRYRDEQCALVGGIEGGSNLWVTHFAAICVLDETKERTAFLRGMRAAHTK